MSEKGKVVNLFKSDDEKPTPPLLLVRFAIPIAPKAQERARSRVVKLKNGKITSQNYTSKKQRLESVKLAAASAKYAPERPLSGPLLLGVRAYMPMPQSKSNKWKLAAAAGEIRPTTKPDLDNILKNIKDALNGVFWEDDKQVVGYLGGTGKYYGNGPRYEIVIRRA